MSFGAFLPSTAHDKRATMKPSKRSWGGHDGFPESAGRSLAVVLRLGRSPVGGRRGRYPCGGEQGKRRHGRRYGRAYAVLETTASQELWLRGRLRAGGVERDQQHGGHAGVPQAAST